MQRDDEQLYLLLDRFLTGVASAAEAQSVREWLREDVAHPAPLHHLRHIRRVAAQPVPPSDVQAVWAKLVKSLDGTRTPSLVRKARVPRVLVALLAVAAVFVAVVGVRAVFWGVPVWRETSTAVAHRAVVRLRDGTQVTLAPGSRLRYTTDFGKAHRDVYLDGEAYFQVTHDTRHPFRVHTARSVTEDLGTAFVVRAYADQNATEVVVAEGRVALWRADTARSHERPGLVLEASDLGRLDANGGPTVRRGIDVARQLAWTRGVLAFDATPLGEVVATLQRWYNVDIRLADSALAGRRLTATFQAEPIDRVLERIALSLGLRVEQRDGSRLLLR